MVVTQKALENFIKTPQYIEALTNQKITEIESFEVRADDPFVVVGKVLTRVDHPNSDHLNLTTVDVGHGDILNIVCGAKNVDTGQTVIVAKVGAILPGNFEIKEAVIRGEQSKGMICSLKELGFSDKVIPEAFKDGIYYFNEAFQPGYSGYKALGQVGFKMELGLTPNRGDLLSVLGYAYDLSAMLNMKVQVPKYTFKSSKKHNKKVTIQSEACSKYMGRVFENVVIKESPWWIKSLLIDNDIRPINNVVDITNYVLLLMGTPLHTFDAAKFTSDNIMIRQAKDQEKVVTLDGQERTLLASDLVISNGSLPVALAGVMGLENTMVTDKTDTIFLEAALFDPKTVLETSKRLNLRSDSSLRFERGVGYDRVALGLDLATQLLIDLADATLIGETVSDERPVDKKVVATSINNINAALGLMLSKDEIINYLMRLRFEVVLSNEDDITCIVPYDRYDISIEADIVEEVGRIYGLDLIPSSPLKTSLEGKLSIEQKKTRQLEHLLTSLGFQQVITYSL
jgi:phenylalanyl-tRNA synthetase beta chain